MFAVVDCVIHCRNSFEAGIQLLELELLVSPGRVNYNCDSVQDKLTLLTAARTLIIQQCGVRRPAARQYLRHCSGGGLQLPGALPGTSRTRVRIWPKLWQSLGPGDAATYEVTSRFCHTCMVPLTRGAARVVCVASTSKASASLRPSPKSSGLLRRCLLMHADLAQAMQADKLRGFAVDAAGYCLWPCKSVSSQRPLGT